MPFDFSKHFTSFDASQLSNGVYVILWVLNTLKCTNTRWSCFVSAFQLDQWVHMDSTHNNHIQVCTNAQRQYKTNMRGHCNNQCFLYRIKIFFIIFHEHKSFRCFKNGRKVSFVHLNLEILKQMWVKKFSFYEKKMLRLK